MTSLRQRLLLWILLPLLLLIVAGAYVSYQRAVESANQAYDRSLYLAARTLAEEIRLDQGRVQVDVLRAAGYLFENHIGSRLYYKIQDADGRLLAGDPEVPSPRAAPQEVHYFSLVDFENGLLRKQPVRLASLRHVLVDASTAAGQAPKTQLITVRVAETLEARQQLIQHILRDTLAIQGFLLAVAVALVWWGIHLAMRPLEAFRLRLAARDESDFSAISTQANAKELLPLIDTLNGYLQRLGRLIDIRKRFLDNAAHQLRTPLAILKTQLALAERDTLGHSAHAAVSAAARTTDNAVHLTEQLLAMTRAEHAPELEAAQPIDLVAMAREVTQSLWQRAHDAQQDLGFESALHRSDVQGNPLLVQEAMRNLVDNALVHAGPNIQVTVRVGDGWVEVEDGGSGIAAHHQAHVFERFYRADTAATRGSGLGLAIVQEIARQHGIQLQLTSPCFGGRGTRIRMQWPTKEVGAVVSPP